jgi:glucose-1-phosphate thymidylyltransferase
MKGLILAGGTGSRLRPITHTSAKPLVPIANKPIIYYVIEQMAAAGIKDIGIIVGAPNGDVEAVLGDGSRFGVSLTFIVQDAPLGLAHCVLIARDFLGTDDFAMYLGDNMLQQDLRAIVDRFESRSTEQLELDRPGVAAPVAQLLLAHVDDPRQFGVVELDAHGRIVRLVEKPKDPPTDLALAGVYWFDQTVHDAVRAIQPSWRNELEITDAIQWLVDQGHAVDHEILEGWWIDTGKKDPLLDCNRLVLDTLTERIDGTVDNTSFVEGRVVIEAGAELHNSKVRGPAIIGGGTKLFDSYVGPYTSIGNDCELRNADIEHSVMLEKSRITGVQRIRDSLIGREVEVMRTGERPMATRLMLGDHSRADLE